MSSARVSREDLLAAADWCEAYETDDPDDPTTAAIHRVAGWLEREAQRRQVAAVRRRLAGERGGGQ